MKTIVAMILTVLFAGSAFATEMESVTGKEAQKLASILARVGAPSDCGAGHCGSEVSDVVCSKAKFQNGSADCSITVGTAKGDVQKHLGGKAANALLDIFIDQGVAGCGMESCQGHADNISCIWANNPRLSSGSTSCSIAH